MNREIVALVGDFYHDPAPTAEALRCVCAELGIGLICEERPERLPWGRLGDLSALVIAREARVAPAESSESWMSAAHEEAIEDWVRGGGALVALHSGLASYDRRGGYVALLRGYFLMHPEEHPRFTLFPLQPGHRISEGLGPFSIEDEMYFVRVEASRTDRLFESRSEDYGSSCASWAHLHGKGRVFCLTPGHRPAVLADPAYRTLLARGLAWATRG